MAKKIDLGYTDKERWGSDEPIAIGGKQKEKIQFPRLELFAVDGLSLSMDDIGKEMQGQITFIVDSVSGKDKSGKTKRDATLKVKAITINKKPLKDVADSLNG